MTGDDRVALVKRLREQASAYGHHRDDRDTWGKAADEIERLSAIIVCERIEHAKAQRDRERLDWLEREDPMCWRYLCDESDEMFWVANSTQSVEHRSLRSAIDVAMNEPAEDCRCGDEGDYRVTPCPIHDDRAEESHAEAAAAVQEEMEERGDGD